MAEALLDQCGAVTNAGHGFGRNTARSASLHGDHLVSTDIRAAMIAAMPTTVFVEAKHVAGAVVEDNV